jgi:eukaryotic-like serine/threonine-protein kinase
MPLAPGSKVGTYEIVSTLGAGGMGVVYRARDTKLNRDVALKVLPDAFSTDREGLARLTREAQVLASLNHPHIAHIHGLEDTGGTPALVLELVEGPTLQDILESSGQSHPLPVAEALGIARQIADALDAAHAAGIVHRDLKPANIKITPEGRVKVLDFGLAKAMEPAVFSGPQASVQFTWSPTVHPAGTFAGTILGTAAYMSPEQARGKPVDKRSDIWAFGVVLYEMVTGRKPFFGTDLSEILASVIKDQPRSDDLPAEVRRLILKCLTKDPAGRLRDIGDAWELLEAPRPDIAFVPEVSESRIGLAGWAVALALGVAVATLSWMYLTRQVVSPPPRSVVDLDLPANGTNMVLSPDGRLLAFGVTNSGRARGENSIWIRSLETGESRALQGTEGFANNFFWSFDSRYLVFLQGDKLRKVAVAGGPPSTLAGSLANTARGGAWNRDGVILVGTGTGVVRVSASDGAVTHITSVDATREQDHISPAFLPDGRHFLYIRTASDRTSAAVFVGSVDNDPDRQPAAPVITSVQYGTADSHVYYAPTDERAPERGFVIFKRDDTVLAQPFDTSKLEASGEAVPISPHNVRFFTLAQHVLVFNGGASLTSQLVWFDRSGKRLDVVGEPSVQAEVALSPEGGSVATSMIRSTRRFVDVSDIAQNTHHRATADRLGASHPVWSPDGRELAVTARIEGRLDLYRVAANGMGEPRLVLKTTSGLPEGWSRDNTLLFASQSKSGVVELNTIALDRADAMPKLYAAGRQAQFSPNGKWVAYASDESGRFEVYVNSFPDPAVSKTTISNAGGVMPRWSRDGHEVFYLAPDGVLVSNALAVTATQLRVATRTSLFKVSVVGSPLGTAWDVAPDGRFLMNVNEQGNAPPATLVMNWQTGLGH